MSSSSLNSWGQSERCLYTCGVQDSYGRIIQPYSPAPFGNTMGQPYVYYTQVQCNKKCSKRKDNRNCFVKAFHWYTQDFSDKPDTNSDRCPDVKGFAAWLDSKYCEYQQESETLRVHNLQSSTTDGAPCPTCCPPCQPCTTRTKKNPRMRSPWRKRKRGNKNAGDMTSKANSPTASCQFILQPQDLTRPGSECGYQPTICEHRSNTTIVISKEVRESNRCVARSRSMTSICDNTKRVQKAPPCEAKKPVTLAPCDQRCKQPTDQENKMSQEIRQVLPKAPKVPCDPPCTIHQPDQVCYQNPTTKQLCVIKDNIQQDPPCAIQQNPTVRQEFEIREDIREVPLKAHPVPCDPPCTVQQPQQVCYQNPTTKQLCVIKDNIQQDPPCAIQQNPTVRQEFEIREDIREVPLKAHPVPCDPPCTVQQPQQVCYQNPTTKQQCIIKDNIQQDPPYTIQQPQPACYQNPTVKQEFKIREEIRQISSKAPTVPCDPPCTIQQPHQLCYQNPTVKQECAIKKVIPSNSQKQTCEPKTTQEQVSLQSDVLEMSRNVDRNKQEFKIVEKTESMISVSQKIETPCDECFIPTPCDECYVPKQEPKIKQETRQLTNAKTHEYRNCDEDCTTKEACKIDQEMRQQHAKLQKELKLMHAVHQTPPYFTCQESCPTPQDCKIMEKLKLMSRQCSDIPCDQSCVANKESKSVEEKPSFSKQLRTDRSICHKFCTTKEKCKFFEELLLRTSNRSSYQTCMPKQEYKFGRPNPVNPQKTQTACEPKEFKMVEGIQNHTQSRGTSLPCEPMYKNEPQYVKTEAKKKPQKQNIECQCPEESIAVKQNSSLQIETKYTPPKYTGRIATSTSVQVNSSKQELDIECQCHPEPPSAVQIKSSKREIETECECTPEPPPSVQAPKVKSSKREMETECKCPPKPPHPAQAPKVKSSKREIETESECPPEPPPFIQAPKVKSSKRKIQTECECPPEPSSLVLIPKQESSKREMDIDCECRQDSLTPVQASKVKSSKRDMNIECQCPPEPSPPLQAKPIKRIMDTDCDCPEEQTSFAQVKIQHTDIERQSPIKPINPAQKNLSKRQIDVECQCPTEIPTYLHPVQAQPKRRKVSIDCKCAQEISVPFVEQSIVSTSTNDSRCKCIVVGEQSTPEKVPSTTRIIQPRTQMNTSIKFFEKSKEKASDTSCQCSTEDVFQQDTCRESGSFLKVNKISLNTDLTITTVNKSCQCSEEDIIFVLHNHIDKSCQYNRSDFESCREIVCSRPEPERPRTICTAQRTDSFTVKNMVSMRKVTRSRTIFRCDGVQTSDHSISLENDDDHDYEFFMKIVCADKLNDCPCFNN